MITVKIIRVPGAVRDIQVAEGTLVAQALNMASITPGEGEAVQVNGQATSLDTPLRDGDRIIIAKGAKGA